MSADCPKCGYPQPSEWCWKQDIECPVRPPRGMDEDLWKYLGELRQRIEHLEAGRE